MVEPRLEHKTVKIKELIDDYRAGRIVIPEFQRDYVWKKSKAPKLIDSLYQGFPISSPLLWNSTEISRSRHTDPRPARSGSMSWLIDGQQRVTTLARTMSGEEGIDVAFNPDEEIFALTNAAIKRDKNWVRVADLWDDELYRSLRRNMDGGRDADRREERFELVRRILDYDVPLVRMIDHSFEKAVSAFTRINTLGVRLKREDIESAQVAARHSGFIVDEVTPFLARIRREGFSRMNVMHLFRACAFIARPDGRRRTPLEDMDRNEVLDAWRKTERATLDAIALIRSELGLVNMNILWSGAFVVPVIAMCAALNPRQRDPAGIAGWIALAALVHRYSGSSETALDQDLRACRANDPLGALLTNLRQVQPNLEADQSDFDGSINDKSGLLALYVACKPRGLLDFYTGGKLLLQDNIDRHHILPRGQFSADIRGTADCIANTAFISGGINKSIGQTGPEVYLKKLGTKIRDSQCVPSDESLWCVDRADDFWMERRILLAQAFNEFVKNALPQRRIR
jgi:hypothetical protein